MQYIHEKMLSFKLKTKGLANRKMRLQKKKFNIDEWKHIEQMMLNHVEIYVNDLKEEHQFWSKILDLLELKILDTWKTGFSIGTSKSYISFNQSYTKSSHQFKRTNQGLNHICLLSFKDKNWILSELAKRNIKILYRNKVISEDTVFIENSWGLKIELLFVNESKKISP